jgi:hypothetical protein
MQMEENNIILDEADFETGAKCGKYLKAEMGSGSSKFKITEGFW